MKSDFNKETSNGLYTFEQDEVFEALSMWCFKRGIVLDKNSVKSFTSTQNEAEGFVVEIDFNHKSAKPNI